MARSVEKIDPERAGSVRSAWSQPQTGAASQGASPAFQAGHAGSIPVARSSDSDKDTGAAFAAAVSGLRELSTPYHLAHGLLDYAHYLRQNREAEAAEAAAEEARSIAGRLGCQPLLDRAADFTPAVPRDDARLDRGQSASISTVLGV
jgi:hypothetical protein